MKPDQDVGVAPPPLHERLTKAQRVQVMIAVAVGTFMGPLDSSVVNIALPSIRSSFHVTFSTVEWVVMSYLLIISSLLLSFGRLGDLYGHRKIYISGFVVFTAGSLLCGIAPSIGLLIFFRALQAVGAGALMSMGPAIIADITPPQERGKSMGVVAVSVSIALATGPVLGGVLTAKFGWPSIFLINVPVGILAILLSLRSIPNTKGHGAQPFDIKGAALVFVALAAILLPLNYAEKVGWHQPYIIGSLVIGIALLVLFVYMEKRIEHPMVDMSLFRNRLFSMSNLSALLNYVAMFSAVLLMPFYFQQLRGMPPSQAGLMMIPMPLTTMLIAPISGALSDRHDTRYISSAGMVIIAIGYWLLSHLNIGSSIPVIVLSSMVVGLGSAMFQTPNNSAVMGAVPPNRRGIASSLLATMRTLGMVLGAAVSGAVFAGYQNYLTHALALEGVTGAQLKTEAFTGAMHLAYLVAAGIAVIAAITSMVRGPVNREASKA